MNKTVRLPSIAIAAVLTSVVLVGATADREPNASTVANLLDVQDCEYECQWEDCRRGHKLIYQDTGKGTHDQFREMGEHPECIALACYPWHGSCGLEQVGSGEDIDAAIELIPELKVTALLELHETVPSVVVHPKRQAVQILGCGEKVLVSVELTADQKAGLELLAPMRSNTSLGDGDGDWQDAR